MNRFIYVLRGIPGSGKSFMAKKLVPIENIFSTDDFWGPNYNFDITKLGIAHNWNIQRVETAMKLGTNPIAVDNTNITLKEITPYLILAKTYDYIVKYIEPNSTWWESTIMAIRTNNQPMLQECIDKLVKLNKHNVPRATIEKMAQKWQLTETLPLV